MWLVWAPCGWCGLPVPELPTGPFILRKRRARARCQSDTALGVRGGGVSRPSISRIFAPDGARTDFARACADISGGMTDALPADLHGLDTTLEVAWTLSHEFARLADTALAELTETEKFELEHNRDEESRPSVIINRKAGAPRTERGKSGRCWCCLGYAPTTQVQRTAQMVARLQAVGWPLSEIDRTSTDRGFNGLRTHLCALCIAPEITPEHAQTISAAVTTFYARASRAKEDLHPHRLVDERAKTIGQSSSSTVIINSHDLMQIPPIPPAVRMPMPTPPNMLHVQDDFMISNMLQKHPHLIDPACMPPEMQPSPCSMADLTACWQAGLQFALSHYPGKSAASGDLKFLSDLRPSLLEGLSFLRVSDRQTLKADGWADEHFSTLGKRLLERRHRAEAAPQMLSTLEGLVALVLRALWRAHSRCGGDDEKITACITWPLEVQPERFIHLCGSLRAECAAHISQGTIKAAHCGNMFAEGALRTRSAAGLQTSARCLYSHHALVSRAASGEHGDEVFPPSPHALLSACDALDVCYAALNIELGQAMQNEDLVFEHDLGLASFSKPP